MIPPNTQWLRRCSLRVGPVGGGQGMDLSAFRVDFRVCSPIVSTPNTLVARIYNLSRNTVEQLCSYNPQLADPVATTQSSVTGQVILDAGYEFAQYGNIFQGDIVQVRAGRSSRTDTYVDIYARDGDATHVWGFINASMAAGATPNDFHQKFLEVVGKYGVATGELPTETKQGTAPRGKTMFGMVRDHLDDFALTNEWTWSINKGALVYIPYKSVRAGGDQAIRLDARTGLLGMPQLTEQGVVGRCLLNPAIDIGTRIELSNASIQLPRYDVQWTAINYLPSTDAIVRGSDGVYKVLVANHVGDTRGEAWFTEFVCIALDSTQLPLQIVGMGIPP